MRFLPRLLLAVLLASGAAEASAQDTIPRPRRDSVEIPIPDEAVRADTLPDKPRPDSAAADTVPPDSTLPAPTFPEFPQLGSSGFGPGVWVFTRADLARWNGLTLEDFFDRIPGLVVTRSGSTGRQMGMAPFGAGGGRVRIFLDGWELRALNGATPDIQRIPLADVVAMRVERGLGEVRVEVSTFRQPDRRPWAQIEGADGDWDTRLLRVFYASAIGRGFGLQLGMDLAETSGFRRLEDFGVNTPFARLIYQLSPTAGLQLDYRNTAWSLDPVETAGNLVPGEQVDRGELMLRGRALVGPVWLDAAVGRSHQRPAEGDTLVLDVASTQGHLRASLDLGRGSIVGSARLHRGDDESWAADEQELAVDGHFAPGAGLSLGGHLAHRTRAGQGGLEMEGWARAALVGGLAAFGSIATGERAVPFLRDSVRVVGTIGGGGGVPDAPTLDTLPAVYFRHVLPTLRAVRAGGEWSRGSLSIGAAFVMHDLDAVAPYGIYADVGFEPVDGGSVGAVEGYASIPLPWSGFRVEGWATALTGDVRRPYLPSFMGMAAIEFHDVFRDGNLEPTLRVEVIGRDRAPLPGDTPEAPLEGSRYGIANAFVQIRILDIRMFWRMENLFNNRSGSDVLGTRIAGARQLYGVRWFFRN